MTSRKPCVNVSTAFYSGKEQSPLHFGLSAEGYELNTLLEGYDHMLWVVKMKNNRKVWARQAPVTGQMQMVHEEPVVSTIDTPTASVVRNESDVPNTSPVMGTIQESDTTVEQDTTNHSSSEADKDDVPEKFKPKEIMKAIVEEKKMTDYNLFLTFRLYELKKENHNKTNKELFNSAIAEWKELKKTPAELKKIMEQVYEFNKTYEKPETKSRKK